MHVAARAGSVGLRIAEIGVSISDGDSGVVNRSRVTSENNKDVKKIMGQALGVVEMCRGMGGTLEALGHVLHACITEEILSAKYVPSILLDTPRTEKFGMKPH